MKPDTVVITRKDLENSVTTIVHAEEYAYTIEEKSPISKYILKKIMGRHAWQEFLKMEESLTDRKNGY